MTRRSQGYSTQQLVLMGVFAALTFIGTQIFRIPVGEAFIHFGNVFLMLAALTLGPVKGAVSATFGFVIFDLLNGYAAEIPKIIILSMIKGLVCGYLFEKLNHKTPEIYAIILATFLGFLTYPPLDTLWRTVQNMLLGVDFKAAFTAGALNQISPIINMIFGVVAVPICYELVIKPAFKAVKLPLYATKV